VKHPDKPRTTIEDGKDLIKQLRKWNKDFYIKAKAEKVAKRGERFRVLQDPFAIRNAS
jgi:hypothetical protein